MTTQNPAQAPGLSSDGGQRVEPGSPLSGEVKRGGTKPFITHRIERYPRWKSAMVTVEKCWFEGDGPIRRIILQQYETASRGAAKSAQKEVAKARRALLSEVA